MPTNLRKLSSLAELQVRATRGDSWPNASPSLASPPDRILARRHVRTTLSKKFNSGTRGATQDHSRRACRPFGRGMAAAQQPPRRFAVDLQEGGISNASTDGSRPDANARGSRAG